MSDYLQLQCGQYRLVIRAALVESVIPAQAIEPLAKNLTYNDEDYPCVDLSAWLSGSTLPPNSYNKTCNTNRKPCLLIKTEDQQSIIMAVDHVDGMITIPEQAFFPLPLLIYEQDNLFDKSYIDKHSQQCIYRLKSSAIPSGGINNT